MAKVDQLPAELHAEVFQGDSWEISVAIDLDLTDYTIEASIHPKAGGDDMPLTVDVLDEAEGEFMIRLSAEQSSELSIDYHSWCLVLTPPHVDPQPAKPRTFLAGRFIVKGCNHS